MVVLIAAGAFFLITFLAVVWGTQRLNVDPLQDVLSPLFRELIDDGFSDSGKQRFTQLASALFIKYGLGRTPLPMLRMRLTHALSTLIGIVPDSRVKEAERYILSWTMIPVDPALMRSPAELVRRGARSNDKQLDVFISYAREDQEAIQVVAARLEANGLAVWWDTEIETGTRWEAEILGRLLEAKVVLVMWSPFSVTSEWVRREAEVAREHSKLVPAFLRKCRLPSGFSDLQTGDLSRWDGDPSAIEWQKVTTSIKTVVSGAIRSEGGSLGDHSPSRT